MKLWCHICHYYSSILLFYYSIHWTFGEAVALGTDPALRPALRLKAVAFRETELPNVEENRENGEGVAGSAPSHACAKGQTQQGAVPCCRVRYKQEQASSRATFGEAAAVSWDPGERRALRERKNEPIKKKPIKQNKTKRKK